MSPVRPGRRWLRWVAIVLAAVLVAALVFVGSIIGYAQWSDDVCATDERARSIPEGSLGTQKLVKWPPLGLRCTWRQPDGEVLIFVATPY